jgi:hypothetical protein
MAQDHDDAAVAEFFDVGRIAELRGDIFGGIGSVIVAAAAAIVDGLFVRRSRFHQLFRQVVDLPIAFVGDENLMLGVEHAQALRHVLQGGGKSRVRFFQRFGAFAQSTFDVLVRGDVVVNGHPSAVRHRLVVDRDHTTIGQLVFRREGTAIGHLIDPCGDVFRRADRRHAGGNPRLEDRLQCRAPLYLVGAEPVHLRIAIVAHHEPLIAVEHRQAVRHVGKRGVQQMIALLKRLFGALQFGIGGQDPRASGGAERHDHEHDRRQYGAGDDVVL